MSIASECGLLLPEVNGESGTGATCAAIFSHRYQLATVHLNLALSRTRVHSSERFVSLIAEGPAVGHVHPVIELEHDHQDSVAMTRTALVGLIWQLKDGLSFDAAVRTGSSEGQHLNELRAGLTLTLSN